MFSRRRRNRNSREIFISISFFGLLRPVLSGLPPRVSWKKLVALFAQKRNWRREWKTQRCRYTREEPVVQVSITRSSLNTFYFVLVGRKSNIYRQYSGFSLSMAFGFWMSFWISIIFTFLCSHLCRIFFNLLVHLCNANWTLNNFQWFVERQGEVKHKRQGEFYGPMYSALLFKNFTALRLAARRLSLQVFYSFIWETRKNPAQPVLHKQTNEVFPLLLPESLKDFM